MNAAYLDFLREKYCTGLEASHAKIRGWYSSGASWFVFDSSPIRVNCLSRVLVTVGPCRAHAAIAPTAGYRVQRRLALSLGPPRRMFAHYGHTLASRGLSKEFPATHELSCCIGLTTSPGKSISEGSICEVSACVKLCRMSVSCQRRIQSNQLNQLP